MLKTKCQSFLATPVLVRCDKCGKPLTEREAHYAFGYGFAAYFCPEHCPNKNLMEGCDKYEEHEVDYD